MPTTVAAPAAGAIATRRESRNRFWALTVGSIGVVYGDIGTSPLYALREAVAAAGGTGGSMTREAVLGVLVVRIAIRVALHRLLAKRSLDVGVGRRAFDREAFIIAALGHQFLPDDANRHSAARLSA